jgi:hypothetical protein
VSVSRAKDLLTEAAREKERSRRHLLVAAALREVLGKEPVVVGGTAEDLYTQDLYRETDLDLCGWVSPDEDSFLARELGFVKDGRHIVHEASNVAVEFPDSFIDGDESRIKRLEIRPGAYVAIIGVDDLYLDRVRQATAVFSGSSPPDINEKAALALALAAYDDIDWRYVDRTIREAERKDASVGAPMRRIHKRIRHKMLRSI